MMEMDIKTLLTLAGQVGFPAMLLVVWYLSDRTHQRTIEQYREDMLKKHHEMEMRYEEMRRMYENNVELVKVTQSMGVDYKEVLLMVCQGLQGIRDDVRTNQFCPNVRLKKSAEGVLG